MPSGAATGTSPPPSRPRCCGPSPAWWLPIGSCPSCPTSDRSGRSGRRRLLRGPPRVEAAVGLLLTQRSLVEADLEQGVEGLAHGPARADAQMGHDLLAVEVRADRSELLLGLELG